MRPPPRNQRLVRPVLLAVLAWTAFVAGLLGWEYIQIAHTASEVALAEARGSFNKDLVYRRWATMHGGVYVPITEETAQNPALAQIPERDITTPSGQHLTLMNPAYMTRQVHELASQQYGAQGHITSLNPIRPENEPDPWEREALQAFERGASEVTDRADIRGTPYLRYMQPMVTEPGCLKCHASQGYQVGQIRGGISVSVPWAPYAMIVRDQTVRAATGHGALWLAGLGMILALDRRIALNRVQAAQADAALQKQRATASAELERKNRELQGILYAVSHDLRSPMLNIQGFSQRIQRRCSEMGGLLESREGPQPPPPVDTEAVRSAHDDIQRSLGFVHSAVEKLDRLIGAMLRLSRLGQVAITRQEVDVNALVSTVIAELAYQIQATGAVVHADSLPSCHGDAAMLGQAFSNLVENALKYRDPSRPPVITIQGETTSKGSVYHVADNGRGIDSEHLDRIWGLFQRLDPAAGPGEGIGLNIVRRVVDRHDGRIWVESTLGQGTCFHMVLPSKMPRPQPAT